MYVYIYIYTYIYIYIFLHVCAQRYFPIFIHDRQHEKMACVMRIL